MEDPREARQFASSAKFGNQGYMSSFNISATPPSDVAIGPDGVRRVVFSVANGTGRTIMAAAELRPSDAAAKDWLSIEGENERTFEAAATQTFKVKVTPSDDAPPGRYTFRLRVVATNEPPDELEAWSEPVAFDVAEPAATTPVVIDKVIPPTNWWRIIAIVLGTLAAVALLAVIVVVIAGGTPPSPSPVPTRTADPTPTPSPTPTAAPTASPEPTLAAPAGVRLDPDCFSGFVLTWQPVAGATLYRIEGDVGNPVTTSQLRLDFPGPRDGREHTLVVIATAPGMRDSPPSERIAVKNCGPVID